MINKVGIVVVTYNRLNLLKEVIEALRLQTYKDFQIVVVNNGSTDETPKWLSDQRDIYTITQENLGGAGGFFTGMKYVVENGFKYCWIMDDDVICDKNALMELISAINVKAGIGFVCSNVLGIDGSPMNTPIVNMDSRSALTGYEDYFDLSDYNMVKVKRATFVSVLFTTDVISKNGLPYKEYFIWGDDTEYTIRLSKKYPCYVALKSKVVHKRKIQKNIEFENETDKSRLNFYLYKYRNEAFSYISRKERTRFSMVAQLLLQGFKFLAKGKLLQSKVLFKSAILLHSFSPQIAYVKLKYNNPQI